MPINVIEEAEKRAAANKGATPIRRGPAPSSFEGAEDWRDPSFMDAVGAAFDNENTFNTIGRRMDRSGAQVVGEVIDADEEISRDPQLRAAIESLPPEYRERFSNAITREELETMVMQAMARQRNAALLQESGLATNLGANIVAGVVDPVDIVVSLATGGVGKAIKTGNTARRVVTAGASAATANAAVEAAISTEDPTRSGTDIAAAAGLGFLLGGTLGAAGRSGDPVDTKLADAAPRVATAIDPRIKAPAPAKPFEMSSYLRRNRSAESAGNDTAKAATSSAFGRYQFTKPTWLSYYKKVFGDTGETQKQILAKRADGATQDRLMAALTKDNIDALAKAKVPVNDTSVYLAHFLGSKDAISVLRAARNTPIADLVQAASIRANKAVFGNARTAGDLISWASSKMGGTGSMHDAGALDELPIPMRDTSSVTEEIDMSRYDVDGSEIPSITIDEGFEAAPGSAGAAARQVEDIEYFGIKALLPGSVGRILDKAVPLPVRSLAGKLISVTPRKDGGVRDITAEETARRLTRQWQARAFIDYNPHFVEWSKERGYGGIRRNLTSRPQQEFMAEVTRAMRGSEDVSPQAKAAGAALAKQYKSILMDAKRAGLPGFEDVNPNANYVPRLLNDSNFMRVLKEVKLDGVQAILKNAMVKGGMPEDLATRVSKAYATGARERIIGGERARSRGSVRGISEDDIERLRYYLPEDDPELIDDVIAHLKGFRDSRNKDAGRLARAKFRIDMDELAEIDINGKTYRVTDLFEDDAWAMFNRYTQSLGGWIALSKRADIRSEADWDAYLKDISEKGQNDPKISSYIDQLDSIKTLITGGSLETGDYRLRRAAGAASKYNFARDMGQAGLSSIAEIGNILAHAGLKNMMMHMPVLRGLWRNIRAGDVDKAFTEELEALFGVGMRMKTSRGLAGFDEYGDAMESAVFDTVDRILDPAARAVSYAGLLGPVNDFLQLLATKSFTQKVANVARGAAKFSGPDMKRLRDAGFHEGVLERAMESIRKHGTFDGNRLVSLGYEKWDSDILSDFVDGVDRMVYRAVQENDIGTSLWWQHRTMGKLLFQFRSFIINAWAKQTLSAAHFRDRQTFGAFAFTMFFGTVSYLTRTYLNYLHDEKERAKRTDLAEVARAAFGTTGYTSIIPTAMDTVLIKTGGFSIPGTDVEVDGPLFSYTRSSGLDTGFLEGNPTYARSGDIANSLTLPARVIQDDYDFSRDDMNALIRSIPFTNLLGVRTALSMLGEDLPKHSKKDEYWQ